MADTPRVTVPVEWRREDADHCHLIYSLMQKGWRKGQPVMVNDVAIRVEACNGSETDIGPIADAIQAALSAAPAPEGGVDGWRDNPGYNPLPGELVDIRWGGADEGRTEDDGTLSDGWAWNTSQDEDQTDYIQKWRPHRALATREEAPAPTCQKCGGEIAGWCCQNCPAEFRENDDGVLVFDEEEAPAEAGEVEAARARMFGGMIEVSNYGGLDNPQETFMADLRTLLRAQPPAREDAQPFGYWVEHKSAENPVLIRYGSFVPASDHYKITTLYTRPAPDALRAADLWWSHDNWEVTHDNLEDAYEDATDSEMRGIVAIGRASQLDPVFAARVDLDTDGDGEPDDYEIRLFATKAEALAALQAEQGAK